jgi:hypothetical protein
MGELSVTPAARVREICDHPFISEKSLVPIVILTPAGTVRIIPNLVYVRWGIGPVAIGAAAQ